MENYKSDSVRSRYQGQVYLKQYLLLQQPDYTANP